MLAPARDQNGSPCAIAIPGRCLPQTAQPPLRRGFGSGPATSIAASIACSFLWVEEPLQRVPDLQQLDPLVLVGGLVDLSRQPAGEGPGVHFERLGEAMLLEALDPLIQDALLALRLRLRFPSPLLALRGGAVGDGAVTRQPGDGPELTPALRAGVESGGRGRLVLERGQRRAFFWVHRLLLSLVGCSFGRKIGTSELSVWADTYPLSGAKEQQIPLPVCPCRSGGGSFRPAVRASSRSHDYPISLTTPSAASRCSRRSPTRASRGG